MTPPVYTVLLGRGKPVAGTPVVFRPVPAGYVFVIRDIQITNPDSSPQLGQGYIPGAELFLEEVPALASVHLELRQVLHSDEQLVVTANGTGLSYWVTGYLFASA